MSDSFLRYWRILKAIVRIKVDLVEADLFSGMPCAADRHGRCQASVWVTVTVPKGHLLLRRSRQDIRRRGVHPLRLGRDDPICHGHRLSIMLTRTKSSSPLFCKIYHQASKYLKAADLRIGYFLMINIWIVELTYSLLY